MILKLAGLTHRYGRRALFEEIAIEVEAGRWLAVAGRNGSGKTTLIRILAGLTRPTRGSADFVIGGRTLSGAERRKAVGVVTPDLAMDADLTARENLRFHARMRELPSIGDNTLEDALLERVGLEGRGGDRVRTFSSGMRQRLKYAFALQHSPPLLLLDEPTANLDASGVRMVDRIRNDQLARGILVVATNEPEEVAGAPCRLDLDR